MKDDLAREQRLDAAIRALPRSLEPERDLWPGIARHLQRSPSRTFASTRSHAVLQLAAAVVLVLASSFTTLLLVSDRPGTSDGHAPTLAAQPALSFAALETPAYLATRDALRADLEPLLERMTPETRQVVELGLLEIRHELDTIRQALAGDPANHSLQELLVSAYQDEIEYLVRVNGLSQAMVTRRTDI